MIKKKKNRPKGLVYKKNRPAYTYVLAQIRLATYVKARSYCKNESIFVRDFVTDAVMEKLEREDVSVFDIKKDLS